MMRRLGPVRLVEVMAAATGAEPGEVAERVDPAALHAAIVAQGDCGDLAALVGGLLHQLAVRPPLASATGRVAVIAAAQCAALNGDQLDLEPPDEAAQFVADIAAGGVEPDKVVTWVAARLRQPHHPIAAEVTMFERFTDRAKVAIMLAQEEARALGHIEVGSEHLVLGLLRERDGVAATVLGGLGVDLDTARAWVADARPPASDEAGEAGEMLSFTPRGKRVLELSLREAFKLGHNHIATEHILLAVAREPDSTAMRLLEDRGVSKSDIQGAVVASMTGMIPPGARFESAGEPSRRFTDLYWSLRGKAAWSLRRGIADGPGCPRCPAEFPDVLRRRRARVAGVQQPLTLVYCGRCGATAAVVPAEEPGEQAGAGRQAEAG